MRSGPWKLHFRSKPAEDSDSVKITPMDLYNLHHDVSETHNIADKHPDVVKRLVNQAQSFNDNLRKQTRPLGRLAASSSSP